MLVQANALSLPFSDNTFDITITSPPYDLGKEYGSDDLLPLEDYRHFARDVAQELYRVTKPTGRLCMNVPLDTNLGGRRFLAALWNEQLENDWIFNTSIVWNKDQVGRRTAWGSFASPSDPWVTAPVELILVYSKGKRKRQTKGTALIAKQEFIDWTFGRWDIKPESAKRIGHPAPFPIELPRRLLKMYAWKEDLVLDPFNGSGSTLVAAQELGIQAIGVDLEQKWLRLSQKRLGIDG